MDAIRKAAVEGCNAINFDEFVFLPVREEDDFERTDYVARMKNYYFHEPHALRLVRCWEGGHEASLIASAGHNATFDGRRVYPHNFILRHYIFPSARHAMQKYSRDRRYAPAELEKGWHKPALNGPARPCGYRLARRHLNGNRRAMTQSIQAEAHPYLLVHLGGAAHAKSGCDWRCRRQRNKGRGRSIIKSFGYIGLPDLNSANDNLWFTLLFKRLSVLTEDDASFNELAWMRLRRE